METEHFSNFMKLLVEENPQAMVSFVLKGAIYEGNLDRELALTTYDSELAPELRDLVLNADELYEVVLDDEHFILHLEFQRFGEQDKPRKIWKCNTMTTIVTGKTVYSVLIYGQPEPDIPAPAYEIRLPNGQLTHSFAFSQIKLWEIEPQVFEQPQFAGLLPLLPLTKNGHKP
jgi:hypothetical protein